MTQMQQVNKVARLAGKGAYISQTLERPQPKKKMSATFWAILTPGLHLGDSWEPCHTKRGDTSLVLILNKLGIPSCTVWGTVASQHAWKPEECSSRSTWHAYHGECRPGDGRTFPSSETALQTMRPCCPCPCSRAAVW